MLLHADVPGGGVREAQGADDQLARSCRRSSPAPSRGNELTTALYGDTPLGRVRDAGERRVDHARRREAVLQDVSTARTTRSSIISGDVTVEQGQELAKKLLPTAGSRRELPTVDDRAAASRRRSGGSSWSTARTGSRRRCGWASRRTRSQRREVPRLGRQPDPDRRHRLAARQVRPRGEGPGVRRARRLPARPPGRRRSSPAPTPPSNPPPTRRGDVQGLRRHAAAST